MQLDLLTCYLSGDESESLGTIHFVFFVRQNPKFGTKIMATSLEEWQETVEPMLAGING